VIAALRRRFSGWYLLGALAFLAMVAWLALRQASDGRLHVFFLDVGQGDAILVQTPDGRRILIDGGPDPTALLSELGRVVPFWDRSLDLVVLTHPDSDHLTGLLAVLERHQVARVLEPSQADIAPLAASWRERLEHDHIPRTIAQRGMSISQGDVLLTVLHPGLKPLTGAASDANNNSIMLRIDYGATSLLLAGDAESEAEAEMLKAGVPLRANLLKVAHHGSNGSTSAAFLAAVSPREAVIQVGANNSFGHPARELLERLADARAEILRTDKHGRIEVVSDGREFVVKADRRPSADDP
jgi:competence protein ComEC